MPRGRPRGTGQVVTIPAVELDFPEVTPYRAGYRLGAAEPDKWWDADITLDQITAHLTGTERVAMVTGDPKQFARWVVIGMMSAILDTAINRSRAS